MRAVLDTNVVASACFWRGAPFECLARWARGDYAALVSPPLLAEYQETYDELALDYPGRVPVNWVAALGAAAELVFPQERAGGATTDRFDEMVLECALAGEADFIVSCDKRHLLALGAFRGIPIIAPADFLRRL